MKIHSKFHDYYDLGLSYGIDPDLHYIRRELTFYPSELKNKLPEDILEQIRWGEREFRYKLINRFAIGFCGELYPLISVRKDPTSKTEYVYFPTRFLEIFPESDNRGATSRRYWRRRYGRDIEFLKPRFGFDKLFIELSETYKGDYIPAPVFLVKKEDREIKIITNERLQDFDFARIKDPFTAFQEISQYLGNQLTHVEEPVQISDKDMIVEKGFDLKSSFRHPVNLSKL